MSLYQNPFHHDPDRQAIWEMLVERDIRAFVHADWSQVADDFIAEDFCGVDAKKHPNPDYWELKYPDLPAYRDEWMRQAQDFQQTSWQEDPEAAIYRATQLRDIDIQGRRAVAHKKFDGAIHAASGQRIELHWQTLYSCRQVHGQWKITGFTGYLPYGTSALGGAPSTVRIPAGASQHITAGPYSPVLTVETHRLIVISGQAAINASGKVIGDTIEEQTQLTLENCIAQLRTAGVGLEQVFKVNVYMTDLDLWPRFNAVYSTYITDPKPVRTTVGTKLLMNLLIEIEMWAIKP